MTTYIVDQSIWSRSVRDRSIDDLVRLISRDHTIVTCPPQALEYCHAARTPTEFRERREDMEAFFALRRHPTLDDILDLQQALWNNGLMRAAGAIDIQIAAYALVNDATVLSADRGFDALVAASGGRLKHHRVDVN